MDADTGRPTVVARGTHDVLHFNAGWPYGLSRYDPRYVARHHTIEPLDAPRGGGFLLDTNSLHRAALERGTGARRAVVLEFHGHGKIQRLGKVDNPCPWGRPQPHVNRPPQNQLWWRGVPGYLQYPQEPAKTSLDEAKRPHWELYSRYNDALAEKLNISISRLRHFTTAWRERRGKHGDDQVPSSISK